MWVTEVEDCKDFDWSLRPIMGWLRMIGIELNGDESTSIRRRVNQLFLFGCHLSLHATFFVYLLMNGEMESVWIKGSQDTITFYSTFVADLINMSVNAIATHFLLLFHISKKWNQLQLCLGSMKRHCDPDLMTKLRRMNVIAVIYINISVKWILILL